MVVSMIPFTFIGCKDKDVEVSYDSLATVLLDFDTAVRPFFSTLELKYSGAVDSDMLIASTGAIKTLAYEMGESFKSFNAVIAELESNQAEDVTLTTVDDAITLRTETLEFVSRLSTDGKHMSIVSKSGDQEYLFEIAKKENSGYYAQVAIKNDGASSFTVYQIDFVGTTGTFNIDLTAPSYTSIYKAEINGNFPTVSAYVFQNS